MHLYRKLTLLGLVAVAGSLCWTGAAGAAGLDYTVSLSWGATTPACADPVVCAGVGTNQLSSGLPASELDAPTSLTLQALASINQPDGNPVPIGVLTYCNGVTVDGSEVSSVKLLAAFDLPGVGTGQAEDVTTLMITPNGEDPQASADSLYLASNPGRTFTVLEADCARIQLLGRVTIEPALQVSLGPEIDPETPSTTSTTSAPTSSLTSSTPSTTSTTTSTSTSTPTSTSTTSTSSTTSLPSSTTTARVAGASATRSSGISSGSGSFGSGSGSSASGLAATGLDTAGPLVLMAVGLLMIGVAATRSQFGRRWYATGAPGVRYTIDRVERRN